MYDLSTKAVVAAVSIEVLRLGPAQEASKAISNFVLDFVTVVEDILATYEVASIEYADNPLGGFLAQNDELLGGMEVLVGVYGDRFSIGMEISGVTYRPDLVRDLHAAAYALIERVDAIGRGTITAEDVLCSTAQELVGFATGARNAVDARRDSSRRRLFTAA